MLDQKIHQRSTRAAGEVPTPVAIHQEENIIINAFIVFVDHIRHTADKPFSEGAADLDQNLEDLAATVTSGKV